MKSIKQVATNIVAEILNESEEKRTNAEFCKLEHHDGSIDITRWGDRSIYSRTLCDANIITWRNRLTTESELREQVEAFLNKCLDLGLELKFEVDDGIYMF